VRLFGCNAGNGGCRPQAGPDVDFDSWSAQQYRPSLDPSEVVFMALNTGFCRDMGVLAMMLEGVRQARKDKAEGEIR